MSCEYNREKLEAYTLGLLPKEEARSIENHIQHCPACAAETANLKKASSLLNQAFQEAPPDWLAQKTMAKLQDVTKQKVNWMTYAVPAAAGVAVLLLMVMIQPSLLTKHAPMSTDKYGTLKAKQAVEAEDQAAERRFMAEVDAVALGKDAAPAAKMRAMADDLSVIPATSSAPLRDAFEQEFDDYLTNPIQDRSIYEDLGVATEVAKLLL